jgi:hypothetical protein
MTAAMAVVDVALVAAVAVAQVLLVKTAPVALTMLQSAAAAETLQLLADVTQQAGLDLVPMDGQGDLLVVEQADQQVKEMVQLTVALAVVVTAAPAAAAM